MSSHGATPEPSEAVQPPIADGVDEDMIPLPPFPDDDVSLLSPHQSFTPSISHVLSNALELNREYQSVLKDQLKEVEDRARQNARLQRSLRALIGKHAAQRTQQRPNPKRAFVRPYFQTLNGDVPQDNEDSVRRQEQTRMMPPSHKFVRWKKSEIASMRKGIALQNQRKMFDKLIKSHQPGAPNANAQVFTRERDRIRNMSEDELLVDVGEINWEDLCNNYVSSRTPQQCRTQWMHSLKPSLNTRAFSAAEDAKLKKLAAVYHQHHWAKIASELGSSPPRTAVQCFQRFQRKLNAYITKSKWTKQDDQKLREAVTLHGEKNWQQVAHTLKGRTGQQCLHRWQKTLKPNIRRGRWTAQEDVRLTLAVKAYGDGEWIKIQHHVLGRTDVQCRERWVNVLNPQLNSGPWTPEEDAMLVRKTNEIGVGRWSLICKHLHPRTDNQCWRRWKMLQSIAGRPAIIDSSPSRQIKRRAVHAPLPSSPNAATAATTGGNGHRIRAIQCGASPSDAHVSPIARPLAKRYRSATHTPSPTQYHSHRPNPHILPPCGSTSKGLATLLRAFNEESAEELPDVSAHVGSGEFLRLRSAMVSLFLSPMVEYYASTRRDGDS